MVELHAHAHAGLTLGDVIVDGSDGGLFAEGDDARGRQHRNITGSRRDGGVVVGDGQLDVAGQSGFEGHLGTISPS